MHDEAISGERLAKIVEDASRTETSNGNAAGIEASNMAP